MIPFHVRRRMQDLPTKESPQEDVRNALQVLAGVQPLTQTPAEVADFILAAKARLYLAVMKLEGRPL